MYATQFDYTARALRLNDISTIHANGRIFQKLDLLAVVTVNSAYTVNVYRRYNSDFNIVIEDCYGNLSFHQDEPMYVTLKNRFGLSDVEVSSMYVSYFYSFKHGTVLNYIPCSIFTMKWSDIQDSYSALDLALVYQPSSSRQQEVHSDDSTKEDVNEPSVKSEESSDTDSGYGSDSDLSDNNSELPEEKSYEPVMYLASLFSCPACPSSFSSANVIVNVQPVKVCTDDDVCCVRICKKRSFCNMSDDSESEQVEENNEEEEEEEEEDQEVEEEEEEEVESDDESRYTVLRNGTKFRKKN